MATLLKEYFSETKKLLEEELSSFFDQKISEANTLGAASYTDMLLKIRELASHNGKMIRPILTACSYQMLSENELTREVIRVCASPELIHKFMLVHDDICDRDLIRYGKPNLTKIFHDAFVDNFKSEESSEALHYGISVAMIGGDLLHTFASDLILDTDINAEIKIKLLKEVSRIIFYTAKGWKEEFDILRSPLDQVTVEQVKRNMYHITPVYTVEGPLTLGAILAETSDIATFKTLTEFAVPLGIAYQIKDDLLGIFGGEESGQEELSDIREGKKTLPLLYAYQACSSEDKKFLEKIAGSRDLSEADFHKTKKLIETHGGKKRAEEESLKLLEESSLALAKLPDNRYSKVLAELINFVMERKN